MSIFMLYADRFNFMLIGDFDEKDVAEGGGWWRADEPIFKTYLVSALWKDAYPASNSRPRFFPRATVPELING